MLCCVLRAWGGQVGGGLIKSSPALTHRQPDNGVFQGLESALLSGDVALGQTDLLTGSVRGELGEKASRKFVSLSNIRFW